MSRSHRVSGHDLASESPFYARQFDLWHGTESKLTLNFESANASVAFIDLAGFSATTDVYGDRLAIEMLQLFEAIVYEALGNQHTPVKWIGDEVMLAFNDSETALLVLGK